MKLVLAFILLQGALGVHSFDVCPMVEKCPPVKTSCKFMSLVLHRSDAPAFPYVLDWDPQVILDAPFERGQPIRIIIPDHDAYNDIKIEKSLIKAYMKANMSVISVQYSQFLPDPTCFNRVQGVVDCLIKFLSMLAELDILKYENTHVITYSYGAIVAGLLGKDLGKDRMLARITALDPLNALPDLGEHQVPYPLDDTCASFVDTYRTNIGFLGNDRRIGHVNVIFNNGYHQPGCPKRSEGKICSHRRSVEYFAESLNSKVGFYGAPVFFTYGLTARNVLSRVGQTCHDGAPITLHQVGENINQTLRGSLAVYTDSKPPYAIGKDYFPEREYDRI